MSEELKPWSFDSWYANEFINWHVANVRKDPPAVEHKTAARMAWNAALQTRPSPWRSDMENAPRDGARVLFWRAKLKKPFLSRADDYWAKPRPHWFDDVTHWQLPLPPEESK